MSMATTPEQLAPAQDLNIRDYIEVLRRRRAVFLQTFVMVVTVGVVLTLLSKPVYQATAQLQVKTPPASVNVVDPKDAISEVIAKNVPDTLGAQMLKLQSRPFLALAREKAGIKPRPGVMGPTVRVEALEGAPVIQVTVEGGHPADVQKFTNVIVDEHLRAANAGSTDNLQKMIAFLKKEKVKTTADLAAAERALSDFRRQRKLVEIKEQQTAQVKDYADVERRLREADAALSSARAQLEASQARLRATPDNLTQETERDNPRYQKLSESLDGLNAQRVLLIQQYKESSREVRDLDHQIGQVQGQLANESRTVTERRSSPNPNRSLMEMKLTEQRIAFQGAEADYRKALEQFRQKMSQSTELGPWEVELSKLVRDKDILSQLYTNLSTRLSDAELRGSYTIAMAELIEPAALPTEPVRPKKHLNIAFSVILAICLGIGMAFLQEYLDDRVNSPDDIERISALPTLGHVPLMLGDQPRLVNALAANSHIAESYRGLRSSIGFAGIDHPIRRLQVTSAGKGEGKSTTSVNLATAMAMDGKRVILVDADMRRPSIHRTLTLPNSPGLSEVLAGMKSMDEALQETDVDGLRVLCAGPIPPNPAELLGSRAFDHLIEQLEERADIVIYDTPPCMPVTDPLIVASRMDGVILVLHVGQTRKGAIKHAVEQLGRARARIVGVVFNRVEQNKGGSYYHHYYYYSGDGYYADAAKNGERQRRSARKQELAAGKTISASARVVDDEDDIT